MKNNFAQFKKFFIIIVLIMLSTFMLQKGAFSLYNNSASAQNEQVGEYDQNVNSLAKSVGFSENYQSFYAAGEPVTLYNFVSFIRFSGESETINTVHPTLNKTYVQILDEMYNAQDNYSVNKYYKTVSNNLLNLVTVIVTETSSLQISKARSVYGKDSANGGIGYSESEKILGILPVQYALEYELLDQIYNNAISAKINTPTYREVCDYNNDGLIDSLSIMLLPDPNKGMASEVKVEWSDLLWPHASQVQMSLINSYGSLAGLLGYSINASHFKYTYNSKTYSAGNYMLSDVNFGTILPLTNLPKNNTFVHELGHVLGWPDYYVYSGADYGETAPSNSDPVGLWEIMASTSFDLPQYPTTYSRNIQGWFGDTGVTEITENGQYTLKQTNYEEVFGVSYSGRTVAYKITNPNNPYQSVWFEYRKQSTNSFERNSLYVPSGLLVYGVDEGFGGIEIQGLGMGMLKNAGNFAAAPYNLYIFRNDVSGYDDSGDLQRAPLTIDNKSMGDGATYVVGGKTYTAANITWQNYIGDVNTPQNEIAHSSVTYENSGMVVTVTSINEVTGEITFEVNYAPLNLDIVTASDFEDSALYDKLLDLSGKDPTDNLFINDLKSLTNLDLKALSLTSVAGLELMQFDNLQTLNLNNNNLNNIADINEILSNNPNVVISLIKNKFNLSTLGASDLQSSHFIWGIQLNLYDASHYVFNNLTHQIVFYWQNFYNAYFTMSLNAEGVSASGSLQYHTFTSYGEYEFDFEPNILGGFSQDSEKVFVTVIGITLPETQIQRNSEFPDLTITGIAREKLDIAKIPLSVDTTVVASNILVTWTISIKVKPTATYNTFRYFNVIDNQEPIITPEKTTPLEFVFGTSLVFPTPEIYITDNGESVNYNYIIYDDIQAGDRSYWTKRYYSRSGSNYTLLAEELSSSQIGEYAIGYFAVDASGNVSGTVYRHVNITGHVIEANKFGSARLYNAILNLTGQSKVYASSLYDYSYINFSSLNITNMNGLELLNYSPNTIIDLSNNEIESIRKMPSLLANENILLINLIFNNLVPTSETIEPNPRYLLGIQGLTKEIYLYEMEDGHNGIITQVLFYNFNDHQNHYTFSGDVEIGFNTISNYGTYSFVYTATGVFSSLSKTIKYGNVYAQNTSLTYDVFSTVSVYDLYEIEGVTINDVEFEYWEGSQPIEDIESRTFGSEIGSFNITIEIKSNNVVLKTLLISLNINDEIAPAITLLGDEIIYLLIGDEYEEKGYSAHDNYDYAPVMVVEGEVDTNTAGTYHITYKARDGSFNYSETKTRTIYIGNITPKANIKVDVYTRTGEVEMFNFTTFSKNDFNLSIVGDSYDEQIIGIYSITVLFTHKQNANFTVERINTVTVLDRIKPIITLTGEEIVYIYVESQYTESGAHVNDNYDGLSEVTNIFGTINTELVGSYTITYRAQDTQGNIATPVIRTVNVIYRPFNSINVVLVSSVESLYLDNMIRFRADLNNYNPNLYDFNSTFIWYVDGVEVQRAKDIYLQTTFDTVGSHEIEVKVLNMNLGGIYAMADGQKFQIQISEGGFLEKYGIPIIITTSVLIVLAVIYSLFLRRKRKFYF